jgi:hypothetical protein
VKTMWGVRILDCHSPKCSKTIFIILVLVWDFGPIT